MCKLNDNKNDLLDKNLFLYKKKNFDKFINKFINNIKLLYDNFKLKDIEIKINKDELIKLKKKYKNLKLRSIADLDNLRKINKKDIEKVYKFSLENFSLELLPVIDNLKYSLNCIKNDKLCSSVVLEGIKLTLKNLMFVIKKFGISIINTINVPFNPNYHQAMSILEIDKKDNKKDNMVISILQDGYLLNERLLRPAMVKVSKYKEK